MTSLEREVDKAIAAHNRDFLNDPEAIKEAQEQGDHWRDQLEKEGMSSEPQMLKPVEVAVLCLVCGCTWEEGKAPEDDCVEATCPCHNRFWDGTDELVKRYLWGDR